MAIRFLQLLSVCFNLIHLSAGLSCAVCSNTTNPSSCQTYKACQIGERCFTTSYGIGAVATFDLGCKSEANCLGTVSNSIVGRDLGQQCSQCCAVDKCNNNLCSIGTPVVNEVGQCVDDPKYDCRKISSIFNICADVAHAKVVCRKWCGLCTLVDGDWNAWSNWSRCDVTCGKGHVIRTRSCTDPAPAHGGLPCSGNTTDVKACSLDPCPIHGGWSEWNSWGTCSQTCSIGLKSRNRQCNNPTPQLAGDHCFGNAIEYKACFERSCADGGWTTWSSWSACYNGEKNRTRNCTNPTPSRFGKGCGGTNLDKENCGTVAFTVNTPNGSLINGHPVFTNIVTNIGGGYNVTTSIFTCPIAGTYTFSLGVTNEHYTYSVDCNIRRNGSIVAHVYCRGDNSNYYNSATATIFVQLSVDDEVTVGNCNNWGYVYRDKSAFFSGALIGP